jgi:hypothetical protein
MRNIDGPHVMHKSNEARPEEIKIKSIDKNDSTHIKMTKRAKTNKVPISLSQRPYGPHGSGYRADVDNSIPTPCSIIFPHLHHLFKEKYSHYDITNRWLKEIDRLWTAIELQPGFGTPRLVAG